MASRAPTDPPNDPIRDPEEAAAWEAAAEDPDFRAESAEIAASYRDEETWPA